MITHTHIHMYTYTHIHICTHIDIYTCTKASRKKLYFGEEISSKYFNPILKVHEIYKNDICSYENWSSKV